jgi:hypothetical protein
MHHRKRLLGCLLALALILPVSVATAGAPASVKTPAAPPALRLSPALWATIDVCNPADQPDTVGIRGSMPGDKHARDTLFMRFRLQYRLAGNPVRWVDLGGGAASGFVKVGSAKAARQAGWSFQLMPPAGRPATTLRGVVTFQWRRGSQILAFVSRATTAGHTSLAGADPSNFSAATCSIG